MDPEMQGRIDGILQRVKEPETLQAVGDLNLVKKVTYSAGWKKFVIQMDIESPRSTCFVCGVVTATIQRSIERDLEIEFRKEFPQHSIEFC